MALKGLDIFKLSPKKNCKECGSPTCMAFCMKVAQGAVAIDKCPYFSDDAKAMLNEQTAPPMKTITVGSHKLGGETVLYRHEKTLVNKNLYAVAVGTSLSAEEADKKLADLQKVDYERIGERMYVEFVFVANTQSDPAVYAALVEKAAATGRDLILECWDVECAKAALAVAGKNVILDGATPDNWEAMSELATANGVALGVSAESLSDLYDTVKKLEGKGNKNLVLDVTGKTAKETLANAVLVRRTAIKDGDRSFGYPSIVNIARLAKGDDHLQTAYASMFTEKYGSILVMEHMTYAQALPLYGLRQNIFTDPQKPMKVESKIYPLNGADENSPCALTVDFALTYFLVSGELERSNQPVNLIITDASGMSVLTAWAAGKFSSSTVKKTFETLDIENKIKNRTLIIPGKAVCKAELQARMGLEQRADVPLFAMVTRMTEQKGFDLVACVLDDMMCREDMQFMLLGSGDERFENFMRSAEGRYKGRLCAYIGYSEELSHLVYAGSDFFLMPSRFEPCGLSQMIAMRYGSVPIVRETGGLRDTVTPYNRFTGEGNGFSFANFDAWEMRDTMRLAMDCYKNEEIMGGLITRAMQADFGFERSAMEYAKHYIWML